MNSSGSRKLLAEVRFGALQFRGRHGHLAAQSLLIDQFFKDDHLQGAIADLRRQIFGNAVVLAGVREDRIFLAQQIRVRKDGTVHAGDRLCPSRSKRTMAGFCAGVCRKTVGAWEATWAWPKPWREEGTPQGENL